MIIDQLVKSARAVFSRSRKLTANDAATKVVAEFTSNDDRFFAAVTELFQSNPPQDMLFVEANDTREALATLLVNVVYTQLDADPSIHERSQRNFWDSKRNLRCVS